MCKTQHTDKTVNMISFSHMIFLHRSYRYDNLHNCFFYFVVVAIVVVVVIVVALVVIVAL